MSNYSYQTSYFPYKENESTNKKRQCDEVLGFIAKGANNLLQLSKLTGLPQSTIAARINDLIKEKKVEYEAFTIYADRKRKRIVPIMKPLDDIQLTLINE